MKRIFYGKHKLYESDYKAVEKVMHSDFLTGGSKIKEFERKIKNYCGCKYAVAVSNATAGLHLANLAMGINNKSLTWTSPNSFVASSNSSILCGSSIDFVDIDIETRNISIEKLECKLKKKNLDLLIPVHFAGLPCDMKRIYYLKKKYKFKVIEDASHAFGSSFNNERTGSCKWSDACVFSFHPVKMFTTAEGGIVTTNNKSLAQKIKMLRDHGIDRKYFSNRMPWYKPQIYLGLNYRMNEIQATLGVSQLTKMKLFLEFRKKLASNYEKSLQEIKQIKLPTFFNNYNSSWHLYTIILRSQKQKLDFYNFMKKNKIFLQVHYMPIHLNPFYQKLGFKKKMFPISEDYARRAITLPLHLDLKKKDVEFIISKIKIFFRNEINH